MKQSDKKLILNTGSNKLFDNTIILNSFLTINELSIWLNVKTKTLYNMVHTKSIPYLKAGQLLRFRKEDIEKWLTRQ